MAPNARNNNSTQRCSQQHPPSAKVKGGWSNSEDMLLSGLVNTIGEGNWSQIARALNAATGKDDSVGRIGKQCRERFNFHLRPGINKEAWSLLEEEMLVQAHTQFGNRWSEIAKHIPGRSENAVKNHWNATKRRKDVDIPDSTLKTYIQANPHNNSNSSSGVLQAGGTRQGSRGAGVRKRTSTPRKRSNRRKWEEEEFSSESSTTEEDEEDEEEYVPAQMRRRQGKAAAPRSFSAGNQGLGGWPLGLGLPGIPFFGSSLPAQSTPFPSLPFSHGLHSSFSAPSLFFSSSSNPLPPVQPFPYGSPLSPTQPLKNHSIPANASWNNFFSAAAGPPHHLPVHTQQQNALDASVQSALRHTQSLPSLSTQHITAQQQHSSPHNNSEAARSAANDSLDNVPLLGVGSGNKKLLSGENSDEDSLLIEPQLKKDLEADDAVVMVNQAPPCCQGDSTNVMETASQHPATAAAAAEPTEDHLLSFLLNSADPVSEHSTEDVQDSSQRCGSNNSQHSSNGQCNSSPPSSEHVTFRASGAARAVHVLVTTDVLPSMDELMQQLQGGGTALTTMMLGSKGALRISLPALCKALQKHTSTASPPIDTKSAIHSLTDCLLGICVAAAAPSQLHSAAGTGVKGLVLAVRIGIDAAAHEHSVLLGLVADKERGVAAVQQIASEMGPLFC